MEVLPTNKVEREKDILWFFDLALLLKAVNGALEMLAAFLILIVSPKFILKIVEFVTSGELAQDPNDFVTTTIRDAAHTFAIHTHYLLALYLALHGAIKVLLVIGIFRGKRIAYPLFMLALILFGAYEAYRGLVRGELLLQALAIFDFSVFLITSYEYRRRYPTPLSSRDTRGDYAER